MTENDCELRIADSGASRGFESAIRDPQSNKESPMLKIGLVVGREWSFPPAFIEEVARRDSGVTAEYVKLGGTAMEELVPYSVIVDRISHEVPYYRTYLKYAALQGAIVVNNPFMWSADD